MHSYIFDIETRGFLDGLSEPDDLFIITAINLDTGDRLAARPHECEALARELYGAKSLIGHNIFGFDLPALQKCLGWWDRLEDPRDVDTMLNTRLIWSHLKELDFARLEGNPDYIPKNLIGSHSLKAWGLRIGEHKDEYSGGFEKFSEEMFSYAQQDVETTLALHEHCMAQNYSASALDLEQSVARLMARQERTGFCFDEQSAEKLLRDLMAEQAEVHERLQAAFPPWEIKTPFLPKANNKTRGYVKGEWTYKTKEAVFNPASRDHIADRLMTLHGWKPKEMTASGKAKIDETILEALPYPEAKLLALNFTLDKRLGQLANGPQAWLKKVKKSGKIHGRVITNGAVTGRATHSQPNLGQVPGNRAPFGERCRGLFVAPPDRVLVGSDASGLELRCLAHFCARYDEGQYADIVLNGDIHTANQHAAGLPSRDQAKTFIYALLYGAGNGKIGSIIGKGPKIGKALKDTFFEKIPAIAKVSGAVTARSIRDGFLKGLDDRLLHIRSPHAALNTLLQSAGALVCKQWLLEMDKLFQERKLDVQFHAWVHDEVQLSCPPEEAEAVGQACQDAMRVVQDHFKFRCQLDTDFNVGKSWSETH